MHAGKLNKDSDAKCEDLQKKTREEMGLINRHGTSKKTMNMHMGYWY